MNTIVIPCDFRHPLPVDVIGEAARILLPASSNVKSLEALLRRYHSLRSEIEADEGAPAIARNLVKPAVSRGIRAARRVPGVGIVMEFIDPDLAGKAAQELAAYLWRKARNEDEVRLIRQPEEILTPLFIRAVNELAATGRRTVLVLDVFERTASTLEAWLYQTLHSDHGDIHPTFVVVVAGRDELGQQFAEFRDAVSYIRLEPFSTEETARYLAQRGVTDPLLVKAIQRDTAGLPVLVELLASRNPTPGTALPDISGAAVERFLSWIEDALLRRASLFASVPRWFDCEILTSALNEDATDAFEWLQQEAFVRPPTSTVSGYHFHEKVRELMLRHLRNQRPTEVSDAHSRCRSYFESQLLKVALPPWERYGDWFVQRMDPERTYHNVAASRETVLAVAASEFLQAFRWDREFAFVIAQAAEQAIQEQRASAESSAVLVLAEKLLASDRQGVLTCLKVLERLPLPDSAQSDLRWLRWWAEPGDNVALLEQAIDLDPTNYRAVCRLAESHAVERMDADVLAEFARAIDINPHYDVAFELRGAAHLENRNPVAAIADLSHAIELAPAYAFRYGSRGEAHRQAGHYDEAVADLTHSIELDPDNGFAYWSRGLTERQRGHYDEALADLTHSIELDPEIASGYAERGETHLRAGHYDQALADLTRAIELDPEIASGYAERGETHLRAVHYDEAIADLTRAIELDPDSASGYGYRGEAHRLAGHYDLAIADLTRSMELDPNNASGYAARGETHREAGHYDEALADLTRSIELDPDDSFAYWSRGQTQRRRGDHDAAIADFTRAIELDPGDAAGYAARGETHRQAGHYDEALADLARSIELDPDDAAHYGYRGEAHRQAGHYDEALVDLTRAIELDPTNSFAYWSRGQAQRRRGDHDAAIADLTRSIELDPDDAAGYAARGETHRQVGHYDEAIADFTRAIELDPDDAAGYAERGETHRRAGHYDEAIADLTRSIELDHANAFVFWSRGVTQRQAGYYDASVSDLTLAIRIDPENPLYFQSRGAAFRAARQYTEAIADFKRVRDLDAEDEGNGLLHLALTFEFAGNSIESERYFADLASRVSHSADECGFLAGWYRRSGNEQMADAMAQLTLALERDDQWRELGYCTALAVLRRLSDARQVGRTLRERNVDIAELIEGLDLLIDLRE
jgi:tetratricopeptide (TPR) repeat protein